MKEQYTTTTTSSKLVRPRGVPHADADFSKFFVLIFLRVLLFVYGVHEYILIMLVLFETAAGYAIFKLLDEKKLTESDNLFDEFQKPEAAQQILKLKHFEKFGDTSEALAATTAAVDGKVGKALKKALKKVLQDSAEQVLTADAKLGNAIKEKFKVACLSNNSVVELMRCIRSQAENLLTGLPEKDASAMALGLAHSLSRYKLKFSPDKVDTMIVQAICLLDELDKELNNYTMRCREWYGWHFPELGKILTDNVVFVKTIKLMGTRDNAATTDLSDILPEEVEEKVKEAAEVSMGTEISEGDILHIQILCDQVLEMTMYRSQLYDYLKSRMMAIAPNLTVLLGDLVGARLISHSGSLINLAKQPASTVQIFGAEKALFRALKNQKDTPKYGLIYHSGLVATASAKNKGKMSRSLAAKASLAARVDALGENPEITADLGINHRAKLETRLKILEEGNLKKISGTAKVKAKFEKYQSKREVLQYHDGADVTIAPAKRKFKEEDDDEQPADATSESIGSPEKKKKKKIKTEDSSLLEVKVEPEEEPTSAKKKKKKKVKEEQVEDETSEETVKTKKVKVESEPADGMETAPTGSEKKKKKKKKSVQQEEEE